MLNAKMTRGIVAIGLVLTATASMWAADTAADAAAAAKGRVTYGRYCVSCHGPQAKGDGPLARDLRVSVPDLTTLAQRWQVPLRTRGPSHPGRRDRPRPRDGGHAGLGRRLQEDEGHR